MALCQGEMRGGPSHCAIYTRQFSNTDTDLTSCEIQFGACHSFLEAHTNSVWHCIGECIPSIPHTSQSIAVKGIPGLIDTN